MASTSSTRQRVKNLQLLVSHRRAEFAFGRKKRKNAKTRRRLLTATGIGLGATGLGLSVLAGRKGSKGSSSSIAVPAISSVAPKNVTSQSSVSSVAPPHAPRPLTKREINSSRVASARSGFLQGRSVSDVRLANKKYAKQQKTLNRVKELGNPLYDLANAQKNKIALSRTLSKKQFANKKERQKLAGDYAQAIRDVADAKRRMSLTRAYGSGLPTGGYSLMAEPMKRRSKGRYGG